MTREKAVSIAISYLEEIAKTGNDEAADALLPLYGMQRSLTKERVNKEKKTRKGRLIDSLSGIELGSEGAQALLK
jgi:hypothetical protein